MKVGILLCGHPADEIREVHGDYFDIFSRLLNGQGLELSRYDVEGMEFPGSVDDADGWLISGSKHGAYEDHEFIAPLEDFIRDAHAKKIPMVGICFGHQIIAQALGGKVAKFDGGWSVGRVEYDGHDAAGFALHAWHQDQVLAPPEGARTVASTDFCAHAALDYPDDGIWTVQPHPEFDHPLMQEFLRIRGKAAGVPDEILSAAMNAEALPIDDTFIARKIGDHFKAHAKVEHV